ncbi:uncharacterized protein LOC142319887 [Lycorma delicatula]|uniref:uncharacterized protein LOC142319887 n=1 Tax=Lycorma delicatula TaxID=130591 RepID=UPI003F514DA1
MYQNDCGIGYKCQVCCVLAASLFTAKAGNLGSTYGAPSNSGSDVSSQYGVPSFGDGGGAITAAYNIPSSSYGAPSGGFGEQGNGGGYASNGGGYASNGGYGSGQGGHDHSEPAKPYEFGYIVKDPHTGSDFKQQETSDGNTVKGQYKVLLPDGRTQIVTYTADWQTGFHADVKYEGEAIYPSTYGNGQGGYGGDSGLGGGSTYGAPSGGYSGGDYSGGDYSNGVGVATGASYNNIGYAASGNGGHGDLSGGQQQYGVPGY